MQKNSHEKHFQNMQKSIVCKKVHFVETTHGRFSRQIMPLFLKIFILFCEKSDFTNFWHFSSQKLCVFYLPATYNQDVLALTISTGCPLLSSFPFPCHVTSAVSVPFFPKTTQAWSSDKAKWTPENFL